MNKEEFMYDIFDKQLKNYLRLEKVIYEAMAMYEENRDDRIKYIIQENIGVAKNQLFVLMEINSRFADLKLKESFESKMYEKLEDLKEIERKLSGLRK